MDIQKIAQALKALKSQIASIENMLGGEEEAPILETDDEETDAPEIDETDEIKPSQKSKDMIVAMIKKRRGTPDEET